MSFNGDLEAHIPVLRKVAATLKRNNLADAADLLQDTLERALKSEHLFLHGTNLQAWVIRLMKNINVDNIRHINRSPIFTLSDRNDMAIPPAQEKAIEWKECAREFGKLPAIAQELIEKIAINGQSYQDVGKELSIPIGTVASRLSRAREQLARSLG